MKYWCDGNVVRGFENFVRIVADKDRLSGEESVKMLLDGFWTSFLVILLSWRFVTATPTEARAVKNGTPECRFVAGITPDGNKTRELVCLYGLPDERYEMINGLTIHNWRDEELDVAVIFELFPLLRRLSILGGALEKLAGPFPEDARYLEVVKISGTRLQEMPGRTFAGLPALESLDLRNNALVRLEPDDLIAVARLRDVYLAGNEWSCDENLAWLANGSYASLVERIADRDEMRCSTPFKGKPLLFVMEVMQEECQQLAVCECELVYVVNSNGNPAQLQQQQQQQQQASPPRQQRQFMAFASVNCSHRGFTDMPTFLPANTTTLHLQGNKISDLTPLKTNPVYKNVIDLYLDDNEIENFGQMDGTYWLEHFRLLSLRGNKMTHFETYVLENVLPHSQTAVSLYLGNNPWRCDCQITPGFQEFLIKYGYLIKDISEVRCSDENTDFVDRQIRELTRTDICAPPSESTFYPLDILNVCMAALILWIVTKFCYDWYRYKIRGKLPCITTLIP